MVLPKSLYGIIGWPLAQTLSPLIHNTAFRERKLPCVYLAWPLPHEDLKQFIDGMRIYNVAGCSVTIPHKIAVMQYLAQIGQAARLAGAVNTLYFKDNELCGENTDVAGFIAPLKQPGTTFSNALLLGAGGAAHAAVAGLQLLGCADITVTSPGNARQFELAKRFSIRAVSWQERYQIPAQLIINSTPLGMKGRYSGESSYDFALGPKVENGLAYDLVYNPLQTRFLRDAEASGRKCISGLAMFFAQANAQFLLWTGEDLPQESRIALEGALSK